MGETIDTVLRNTRAPLDIQKTNDFHRQYTRHLRAIDSYFLHAPRKFVDFGHGSA
jgi:hypothetical protein